SPWRSGTIADEQGEPAVGLGTPLIDEAMKARDLRGAAGDDSELGLEAFEVELANHARVALLDEEFSGAGLDLLLEEEELALSEGEAVDIVLFSGIGVGEEDLGWGLLDDGSADGT